MVDDSPQLGGNDPRASGDEPELGGSRRSTLPPALFDAIIDARSPAVLDHLYNQVVAKNLKTVAARELVKIVAPSGFLRSLMGRSYEASQRLNALRMVRRLEEPVNLEPIIKAIYDRNEPTIRREAVHTMEAIAMWLDWSAPRMQRLIHAMQIALSHQDRAVRLSAARLLGHISAWEATDALLARLEEEIDDEVRQEVALALGKLKNSDLVFDLLDAYENQEIEYEVCAAAIKEFGEAAVDPLISVVRRWNVRLISRCMAADVLGDLRAADAFEPLLTIAERRHEPADVRVAAIRALGYIGDRRALPTLYWIWDHERFDPALRRPVDEAINRIN